MMEMNRDDQVHYGPNTRIAQQAVVYGQISLGDYCSIWPYAVLRGDINNIRIGDCTNIQESVVIHVGTDAVWIGDRVTIGHGAIVHGCHIDSDCLIGMHATLLDGATISHHCIIGANTLVTQHKSIPPYSLVCGSPGRVVRTLTEYDVQLIQNSAQVYLDLLKTFPF